MEIDIERVNASKDDLIRFKLENAYQQGYRAGRMSAFLEAIEMVKNQEQIKVDMICDDLYNEDQKNKTQEK